jgi:hypothetical protein
MPRSSEKYHSLIAADMRATLFLPIRRLHSRGSLQTRAVSPFLPQLESILTGLDPPPRGLVLPPSGGKGRTGDERGLSFVIYALPSQPLTSQHTQEKITNAPPTYNTNKPAKGQHVGDFGSSLFPGARDAFARDAHLTKEHPRQNSRGNTEPHIALALHTREPFPSLFHFICRFNILPRHDLRRGVTRRCALLVLCLRAFTHA